MAKSNEQLAEDLIALTKRFQPQFSVSGRILTIVPFREQPQTVTLFTGTPQTQTISSFR